MCVYVMLYMYYSFKEICLSLSPSKFVFPSSFEDNVCNASIPQYSLHSCSFTKFTIASTDRFGEQNKSHVLHQITHK